MATRNHLGQFVAGGEPGNPTGRPKSEHLLVGQACALGPKCITVLAKLLDHKDPKVRADAAKALLDRAYGKPRQSIEGHHQHNYSFNLGASYLEAAREISQQMDERDRREARAIDVTPGPRSDTPIIERLEAPGDKAKEAFANRHAGC